MTIHIEMFPQPWIDLNEEVAKHPALMKILSEQQQKDPYILLADIALYCGVALDGTYTNADIETLCELLRKQLYMKRTGLVIIH